MKPDNPDGHNIPIFHTYIGGCPRKHLMIFLNQYNNIAFSQALLLKQFPLSLSEPAKYWLYTFPCYSIANWDIMDNRFSWTFYPPLPINLDARTWEEGVSNEALMMPFQTPLEASAYDLINVILDLNPLPDMWPWNLFLVTVSPLKYGLPIFVIYPGHTDPLKHLRRFKRQCWATAESDAVLLNNFHCP